MRYDAPVKTAAIVLLLALFAAAAMAAEYDLLSIKPGSSIEDASKMYGDKTSLVYGPGSIWRPQLQLDEKIKHDIDHAGSKRNIINIDRKYERAFNLEAPVSGLFVEWVIMRAWVEAKSPTIGPLYEIMYFFKKGARADAEKIVAERFGTKPPPGGNYATTWVKGTNLCVVVEDYCVTVKEFCDVVDTERYLPPSPPAPPPTPVPTPFIDKTKFPRRCMLVP